jgi:glycerol uptake facilitator-like aquaporin
MSQRRITAMITFVWVYSAVLAVIPVFGINEWNDNSWAKCELENILPAPFAIALVLHFFICSMIMTFLYGRVFCLARDHANRIKQCTEYGDEPNNHYHKGRISKATMTLFLVLGIFILSWLPFYTIFGAYEILRLRGDVNPDHEKILIYLRMVTSIIGLANSMWNPMIYAGKNKDFRMAFKKLLGSKSNNSHELLHLKRTSVVSNPDVIF